MMYTSTYRNTTATAASTTGAEIPIINHMHIFPEMRKEKTEKATINSRIYLEKHKQPSTMFTYRNCCNHWHRRRGNTNNQPHAHLSETRKEKTEKMKQSAAE